MPRIVITLFSLILFSIPVFAQSDSRSLTLAQTTELAIENSLDIQLLKYDVWVAQTQRREARSLYDMILNTDVKYRNDQSKQVNSIFGSKTLTNDYNIGLEQRTPFGQTLNVEMQNNRNWTNSPFQSFSPSHDSSLAIRIKQELGRNFLGIKDRARIKISLLDVERARFTSLEKIEREVARVQKAYWDLVLYGELKLIGEQMLEQARKLYLLAEEKKQAGLVELPELYGIQANYKKRETDLAVDMSDLEQRQSTLKFLLNLEENDGYLLAVDAAVLPELVFASVESLKSALRSRRDYQRALTDVKLSNLELEYSRSHSWPEINLTASLAKNGIADHFPEAVRQISTEDNPELFAGLAIHWPLANTQGKAQVERAKLEQAKSLIELKLLERKIAVDVVDHTRTCNVALQKARALSDIAALQKEKYLEEEKRFNSGRSNTDTLIRYQEDWLQAQWEAARAVYEFQAAAIDLKVVEGTLLNNYWDADF